LVFGLGNHSQDAFLHCRVVGALALQAGLPFLAGQLDREVEETLNLLKEFLLRHFSTPAIPSIDRIAPYGAAKGRKFYRVRPGPGKQKRLRVVSCGPGRRRSNTRPHSNVIQSSDPAPPGRTQSRWVLYCPGRSGCS
jgi:hypothetical protein